jgi:phosphatidylinositol glycan class W
MNPELEIFLLISLRHTSTLVYESLNIQGLLFSFLTWVLPMLFCILFPKFIIQTHLILLFVYFLNRNSIQKKRANLFAPIKSQIMLMVTIAIFAWDFSYFPQKFGKTKFYGVSLMDVGIGSFLYHNGAFSTNMTRKKILKSAFINLFLGFVRFFVLKHFNYTIEKTEYGRDLSFYFILSFVYLLFLVVNSRYNLILGLLIVFNHQRQLNSGLAEFILSDSRIGFLEENKEGIFSILPSLSIFLIANFIKKVATKSKIRCLIVTIISFLAYFGCKMFHEVSRRLCNSSFVFWIVFIHSIHIFITLCLNPTYSEMDDFVSKNMLFVFLWSNLIVLISNLMFKLKEMKIYETVAMNVLYLWLVFYLPALIASRNKRKIK